jgi:23S rRNA pseudouridine1911/1915/1917 synthase
VDAVVVTDPTTRVAAGAMVAFDERASRPRRGELRDSDIVYVDAHVIVVAKPPGISTVPYHAASARGMPAAPAPEADSEALEGRVRGWLEQSGKAGRPGRPPLGVVHRIDKETSGLVVFTRTWLAKQRLASQFRRHTVHRRYLAIASGDVETRTFRSFLIEDRGDGLRGSARGRVGPDAREAITHVERLEALPSVPPATLVACRLETGRTHQIRIHLSEAGHPIVGEKVYVRARGSRTLEEIGPERQRGSRTLEEIGPERQRGSRTLEAPRLMLHAAELGFLHPATEREMHWELPMPEDMKVVLERLRLA